MRIYRYKKFLFFVLALFLILSLGPIIAKRMQTTVIALLSPVWKMSQAVCHFFRGGDSALIETIAHLEAENYLLRKEMKRLTHEESGRKTVVASVVYRDPTSWNSTLWVDVGEVTNKKLGAQIIAKNSCVLVGHALVGIIDHVGPKQSRVRLLTDRRLHPSVRSVRGELKNQAVIEHLDVILSALRHNKEYATLFEGIKEKLEEEKETLYLAKGYLQGAGAPLWRRLGTKLVGIGFNYDFADNRGEAKRINIKEPKALLQEGDLLVTTGMDGVFPPDLFVAFVTKVYPLKEGDVSYKIEAEPYLSQLSNLQSCTIMAPLECTMDCL